MRIGKTIAAGQTDVALVTAKPNQLVIVYALFLFVDATATTITFNTKGAGAGTAIDGATFPCGANGGASGDPKGAEGYFQTNTGEGLTVTTGAGSTCTVIVWYEQRTP